MSIPRALSFHDYWSQFTAQGRTPMVLPREVYVLEPKAARVHTTHELLFRDHACMTRASAPLETSILSQSSVVGLRAQPSAIPMVAEPGESLPLPGFPFRRVRIQGDPGRGGLGYRFTVKHNM